MKTLLIILLLLLGNFRNAFSDGMFEIFPTFGEYLQYNYIAIDKSTSIDSINIDLIEIKAKYFNIIHDINPYSVLIFSNMNQYQIDSSIRKINLEYKQRFIKMIIFDTCTIRDLPLSFRDFQNITSIVFNSCDSINSLNGFNSASSIFTLLFENCRISKLPEGTEMIKSFIRLIIAPPFDCSIFNIDSELKKFQKRNNIIDLFIYYRLLEDFPQTIFQLTSLQNLTIFSNKMNSYKPEYEKLVNLINLFLTDLNDDILTSVSKNSNIELQFGWIMEEKSEIYFEDLYNTIHHGKGILYKNDIKNIEYFDEITLYRFESKNFFKEKHLINHSEFNIIVTQDSSNYKKIKIKFEGQDSKDTISGTLNYVTNYELDFKLIFINNECEIDLNKFKYHLFNMILLINNKKYNLRINCMR